MQGSEREDLFPGEAAVAGRYLILFAPASGGSTYLPCSGRTLQCISTQGCQELAKSTPSFVFTSHLRVPPTSQQTPVLSGWWCTLAGGERHVARPLLGKATWLVQETEVPWRVLGGGRPCFLLTVSGVPLPLGLNMLSHQAFAQSWLNSRLYNQQNVMALMT